MQTTTQQSTIASFAPNYIQPTPPPIPDLEERPNMTRPEDCPTQNCFVQKCAFGIDNYIDNRGCPRCRCSHPCHVHVCPTGQKCAVEIYRTETNQPVVQPVCRLINKTGECPKPNIIMQLAGCKSNEFTTNRNPACGCDSTCRIGKFDYFF